MTVSESFDASVVAIRTARRLVVFTGAGVSAESGIPTFREDDGFWREFPPEQFARWDGLIKTAAFRPRRLAEFLLAVIDPIAQARPNPAHLAIERLESFKPTLVITQNVDGLHQEAGSTTVREIHGTFLETESLRGRFIELLSRKDLQHVADRLRRARGGLLVRSRLVLAVRKLLGLSRRGFYRPRLVLFGDQMAEPDWTLAQRESRECDTMLVVGTSGQVWPAATLPFIAKDRGATIIEVCPDEPSFSGLWLRGSAAAVLPRLVTAAFSDSSNP